MASYKQKSYKQGIWAERFACLYLMFKGYRILTRRYKTSVGEVDIVACRRGILAMVEVKSRKDLSTALAALNYKSRKRIIKAALHYIASHPRYQGYGLRFDLIAISTSLKIRHLDNAWQAEP